jgi:cyanophycinase
MKTFPKGILIPIGGNEAKEEKNKLSDDQHQKVSFSDDGILKIVLNEIKSRNPIIEILPIASINPDEMENKYSKAFSRLGVKVNCIHINHKGETDKPENLERLAKANGIFFTGGDQKLLVHKLEGSEFLNILTQKYLNEEFVIAGTSAGAMAMGDSIIFEGNSNEAMIKGIIKTGTGLNLIDKIIIDTHFFNRGRLTRLIEALIQHKRYTGIGIGEDTALILKNGSFKVIGNGTVMIVEPVKDEFTNYEEINERDPVYIRNLKMHLLSRNSVYDIN